MPLIKRTELPALLKEEHQLHDTRIFLFFGERYLCREAADALQEYLLRENGAVTPIEGDQEDHARTLARLKSFSLLPGRQIYRVTDSRIFHSKTVAADIWEKALAAEHAGKAAAAMRYIISLAAIGSLDLQSRTPLSEVSAGEWERQFGFTRPESALDWADSLLVQAVGTGKLSPGSAADITEMYITAFSGSIPKHNYLILTAETVDKRQKLFSFIKNSGLAVDCSVAAGAALSAQKEQKEILREMVDKTLREFGKKIDPQAVEIFFERVGFQPSAVVTETEKLALFTGERQTVTCEDVEQMVARSREDALFELTDAFGKRQVGRSLTILKRLQDNGTHGLAILATMRNYIRKMLIYRSLQLQDHPAWLTSMNAKQFQNSYLPALKENEEWKEQLGGHPYGLFMSFSKAAEFSCNQLKIWLTLLLEAEYRLKGSPLPQHIILEDLFLSMFRQWRISQ